MRNGVSRRVAQRFVAGETLDDAIAAARTLNAADFRCLWICWARMCLDRDGAVRAAETYLAMFDRIAAEKLDGNISLKLTQLGLDLDPGLCEAFVAADCGLCCFAARIFCAWIWRDRLIRSGQWICAASAGAD